MKLKFETRHRVTFDEFYKARESKLTPKFVARKRYNEFLQSTPNHEWIVCCRFFDSHIEVSTPDGEETIEYGQYNGILNLAEQYCLHRYGTNVLKVYKADFVLGDAAEFPHFISEVISQEAPSQLIRRPAQSRQNKDQNNGKVMEDRFYDTPGGCKHGMSVDLVNENQILFFPILWGYCISEAAVIFDYPMNAEEIGSRLFRFFEQMRERNLTLHDPFKNYWFMPKGIRSFKKYVEAAYPVSLVWDGEIIGAYRWFPAPDRGFTQEGDGKTYDATISTSVSAESLGEFVLQQFDYIRQKRRGAGNG